MATQKIETGLIADSAVTTAKLADNSVTAAKIAAGSLDDQVKGISSSADAVAITIDSSENVGIGTDNPSSLLTTVTSSNSNNIQLRRNSTTTDEYAQLGLSVSTGTGADNQAEIRAIRTNSPNSGDAEIVFLNRGSGTGPTEAMRIDSEHFVLIGKTSSANVYTTAGIDMRPSGTIFATRDQATSLVLSRTTNDGEILNFRKDGSTVGSIGTASTALYISNDDTGLQIYGGASIDQIVPCNATGATRDNAIDLGKPTGRFKDLYLSGTLTNDGTGGISIDTSGNVGIGNSSPTRNLTVGDTAASSAINIKSSATNGYSILALGDSGDDNYAQIFLDNGTNKLQIQNGGGGAIGNRGITLDSSENVGIGTSNPTNPLHVSASTTDVAKFETTGAYTFVSLDNATRDWALSVGSSFGIYDKTAAATRLSIDASGHLDLSGYIDNTRDNTSISPPSNSNHTVGTRIKFYDAGEAVWYAMGIENNHLWFNADPGFKFYSDSVLSATIDDDGIKFKGDTAAANALDDYEEGTWTPTITTGSGSITLDSGENLASYTKIGRMVYITGRLLASSVSSPSGSLEVTNLPFTVLNLGENSPSSPVVINLYNLASNISGQINAEMSTGNAILIRDNGATTGNVQNTMAGRITNGSRIGFTAVYVTSQ